MRKAHFFTVAGLALFSFCWGLDAQQTAFLLPGSSGSGGSSTVTAYTLTPLATFGTLAATASAYQALVRSDGSEFYVISNSATNTVITSNTVFNNVQGLVGFGAGAAVARLTPDGRKLLVGAGNLQVINTASDTLAAATGVSVGGTVVDIAVSLDSTQAFVLVNTGSAFQLRNVDLRTLQLGNAILPIGGQATGVVVGPNGLVYVGSTNLLNEIDPSNLAIRNTISINGVPGKLGFTPDGKLGLAINQTPITGSSIFIFDLSAKTLSSFIATSSIGGSVTLSKLMVVSNNRVLAFSSQNQTLYDVTLTPQTVNFFAFATATSVTLAETTTDLASGTHAITQYLLYVSGNILYEFDLGLNQIVGQLALSTAPGAISIATAANTGGTAATLLKYGDLQTVPLTGTSTPLVVRAVDGVGKPVASAGVTFSTTTIGATLSTTSTTTNNDGLAATTITVPNVSGPISVLATVAGGLTYTFTVNVGTVSGGGGGQTGALSIVQGQGSLIQEGNLASASNAGLVVKFTDAAGNPVSGATITYTLTAGNGTIQCPAFTATVFTCASTATGITINTDANGLAQADYLAGLIQTALSTDPATITASATIGSSVTFFVTSFRVNIAPPSALIASPQFGTTLTGQAGQKIPAAISVQVATGTGQPIPNVSLRILNPPDPALGPSATCAGTFALSDSSGSTNCDLVLGGKTGTVVLTADEGYTFDFSPIVVNVTAGPPGKVKIVQGNNQTGKPGTTLPLALLAQVTDAFDNVLPQTPVTFKVLTPGAVTLSQVSSATDSTGRASALVTIGSIPGTAQIQVTAGSASATFTVTVSVPISGIQLVSGSNQAAVLNAKFANPLVVRVTDAQSNPVQNLQITFAVTSGSGTLSNPTPSTDATGTASTSVTAGNTAGALVVTATAGSFSVTFNLTVSPPGPSGVVFLNGASFQPTASAGAIVTLQGLGLTPGIVGVVLPNSIIGPLPTSLAGISVTFNNIPAPIFSVSNVNGVQQITVQVPFEVAGSSVATVVIKTPGGGTGTFTVTLQPYSPGVFSTNSFGLQNQAVAIRPDGSFVSPTNPAHRGEDITIFAVGVGQTTPATGTNLAGILGQNVAAQMAVGVNNVGIPLVSAQTVVGLVGVYAITMHIPNDAITGPQQPVGFIVYNGPNSPFFAAGTVMPIQ